MNGEERQLIMGLFDRLRGVDPGPKDRDAEGLINQSMRQNPDAAYLLVQTNLVQEHALEQAGQRMQDLEQRVRELEDQVNRQPQQSAGGGSFLGGLFGGSNAPQARPAQRSSSVPSVGSRPMGAPQGGGSGSPWGNAPGYGNAGPQQQYGGPQGYGAPPPPAPGGGGGFMRSALTTAAGVAGGMLVASTISNMMHGSSAHAAGGALGGGSDMLPGPQANETSYAADSNDPGTYDDAAQDAQQDADDTADAQQDADDDNDQGWGGSDGGDDGSTDA